MVKCIDDNEPEPTIHSQQQSHRVFQYEDIPASAQAGHETEELIGVVCGKFRLQIIVACLAAPQGSLHHLAVPGGVALSMNDLPGEEFQGFLESTYGSVNRKRKGVDAHLDERAKRLLTSPAPDEELKLLETLLFLDAGSSALAAETCASTLLDTAPPEHAYRSDVVVTLLPREEDEHTQNATNFPFKTTPFPEDTPVHKPVKIEAPKNEDVVPEAPVEEVLRSLESVSPQTVEYVRSFLRLLDAELEIIASEQARVLTTGSVAERASLLSKISQLLEPVTALQAKISEGQGEIVRPALFRSLLSLGSDIELLKHRLNMLRAELLDDYGPPVTLVITRQPPPTAVFRQKPLPESFVIQCVLLYEMWTSARQHAELLPLYVQLYSFAKCTCRPLGPVQAEWDVFPSTATCFIENGSRPINERGVAVFDDISFGTGSQAKRARLKFSIPIEINGLPAKLSTGPSNSFVVMTNHGQRVKASLSLLEDVVFGESVDKAVEWSRYANYLQLFFLQTTGQSLDVPTRPLSLSDLKFLRGRMEGDEISRKDHVTFWAWYGKVLLSIRNPKRLSLWNDGLIHMLGRRQSMTLMSRSPPGTALLRFSGTTPGNIAAVYADDKGDSESFMMDEDIEIPVFLQDCPNVLSMVQAVFDHNTGSLAYCVRLKDDVLGKYYHVRTPKAEKVPFGYNACSDLKNKGMQSSVQSADGVKNSSPVPAGPVTAVACGKNKEFKGIIKAEGDEG